jgi:hypothetical protein
VTRCWPSFLETRGGSDYLFRYLLVEAATGEPYDPAVLVTEAPDRRIGETIVLGDGSQARILDIDTNIGVKLVDLGFNAVLAVEPVDAEGPKRRGWLGAMQTRRQDTIGDSASPSARGLRWASALARGTA